MVQSLFRQWAASSVGRAPRSQRGGREFEPPAVHHPSLAFGELRMASQASCPHAKDVHRSRGAAKVDRAHFFFLLTLAFDLQRGGRMRVACEHPRRVVAGNLHRRVIAVPARDHAAQRGVSQAVRSPGRRSVFVVVTPPPVRRCLRVALRRVLPLLLAPERGYIEVAPGSA